jgi:XTP/dITP diphosphohydrolase
MISFAPGAEWVIASHNRGKIPEIQDLLAPFDLTVSSAADYDLPEPEETENSFEGNALLKARYVCKATGKPALSDDSGLCVNALNGAPGVYSARWAGENKDFRAAGLKIQQELQAVQAVDYSAAFFCALALVTPAGEERVFLGTVRGTLAFPARGDRGFGYDPIFIAEGMTQTFGEIEPELKHSMSHRADAFRQLVAALSSIP